MSAKVSVIIPAYNSEKYLAEAIQSVLDQSHGNVECIVVDDGSTDRTAEIANGFGPRVQYKYQANAERSHARNTGLAIATGQYISFLDADDILAREKLAEQLAYLDSHSDCEVVYSKTIYFKDDDDKRNYYSVKRITPEGDIFSDLIYGNFITVSAPLIRRKAIEQAGGFDPSLSRYEDWEFLLRLSVSGAKFGFLNNPHVFCRIHAENTIKDQVRMFKAKLHATEKLVETFGPVFKEKGIDASGVLAFHQADYGRILVLAGQVDEGRQRIENASRQNMPHKMKFRIFALAAGFVPVALLVKVQQMVDQVTKYRKEMQVQETLEIT